MFDQRVKSAARVIEIFEYFASTRKPARMKVLATEMKCPPSSMIALLRTLVSMGYLQYDEATHAYFPASRMTKLTNWIEPGGYEQTIILDAMHRLRDAVGEPVVLATPKDCHIEYVVSLHCNEGTNSHIRAGTQRLIVQNGIGWLMLSRMPVHTALGYYRKTISTGALLDEEFSEDAFLAILDAHRQIDISVLHARDLLRPTAHWNASMIGTLIPVPEGHRSLGIGVHGPTKRMEQRTEIIKQELRATVGELASYLETHGT